LRIPHGSSPAQCLPVIERGLVVAHGLAKVQHDATYGDVVFVLAARGVSACGALEVTYAQITCAPNAPHHNNSVRRALLALGMARAHGLEPGA
jgi:hypothetical protein